MVSLLLQSKTERIELGLNDVLYQLVSLSYIGDIRTYLGIEPKDKIKGIVEGQNSYLREIYQPLIDLQGISMKEDRISIEGVDLIKQIKSDKLRLLTTTTNIKKHIKHVNLQSSTKLVITQFFGGSLKANVN